MALGNNGRLCRIGKSIRLSYHGNMYAVWGFRAPMYNTHFISMNQYKGGLIWIYRTFNLGCGYMYFLWQLIQEGLVGLQSHDIIPMQVSSLEAQDAHVVQETYICYDYILIHVYTLHHSCINKYSPTYLLIPYITMSYHHIPCVWTNIHSHYSLSHYSLSTWNLLS